MLTGDLDRLLAAEVSAWRPPPAAPPPLAWQPAPPDSGAAPGTYATPVALRLADGDPRESARIAMTLAAALRRADWVDAVTVTGGYVTVTVTRDALARLAVRVTEAGPACARGTSLAGATVAAPPAPDLAAAPTWASARRHLAAYLTGRLAEAAGARTFPSIIEVRRSGPARRPGQAAGPVAAAIGYAGAGPIRYALARLPPGAPARVDPCHAAARRLDVPAYAVRYAHAHAKSTLRQAADLGLSRGEAAEFDPRPLAHPSELRLLDELSWLAERVAGAARRARPDTFPRHLERLAGAYFDCHERCPAVWPGIGWGGGVRTGRAWGGGVRTGRAWGGGVRTGRAWGGVRTGRAWGGAVGASRADGGPGAVARLWLAAATATALHAGLDLLGVDAPDRL